MMRVKVLATILATATLFGGSLDAASAEMHSGHSTESATASRAINVRGDVPSSRTARLHVRIVGLPRQSSGRVLVARSASNWIILKHSSVLRLVPGRYLLRAAPVRAAGTIWVPIRDPQWIILKRHGLKVVLIRYLATD